MRPTARGIVAVVLVLAVATCIVILAWGVVVDRENGADPLLDTALGAAIGAISVFLGGQAADAVRDAREHRTQTESQDTARPTEDGTAKEAP